MTASTLFLCGLGLTLFLSLAAVIYLRSPLQKILVELCGNSDRASFWTAFCNVTLTLVPLVFSMHYTPGQSGGSAAVLELANQLEWGLAGLIASVLVLGWVLSRFISRIPAGRERGARIAA